MLTFMKLIYNERDYVSVDILYLLMLSLERQSCVVENDVISGGFLGP